MAELFPLGVSGIVAVVHSVWFWRYCPEEFEDHRFVIALLGAVLWPVVFVVMAMRGYYVIHQECLAARAAAEAKETEGA